MSIESREFYALRCDFPDCGELFDDGEYSYYTDGPEQDSVDEAGWLVIERSGQAYCSTHVIEIECPPEAFVGSDDDAYCQWCEDHATGAHLAPMPDTWLNRLLNSERRVVATAHWALDNVSRRYVEGPRARLGENGEAARQTNVALVDVFRATCLRFDPLITEREIRARAGNVVGAHAYYRSTR